MSEPLSLNDLPRHLPWPARLLGTEPWAPRSKSPGEVLREYETEKWSSLLARAQALGRPPVLEDLFGFLDGQTPLPCLEKDALVLMTPREAREANIRTLADELAGLGATCEFGTLVELGAGFGQMILSLAAHPAFEGKKFVGAELARSGVELIRLAAAGKPVQAGHCDFLSAKLVDFDFPTDSLTFTSYAACCLEQGAEEFLLNLRELRPGAVAHFEPLYEQCGPDTLLGLMQRRYIELNGYNRDLLSVLRRLELQGKIRILAEKSGLFAINPFLPPSFIVWQPV